MFKRSYILILLFGLSLKAQTYIYVVDSLTQQPIEDVVITGSKNQTVTDKFGFFDLDKFAFSDSLTFKHLNYYKKTIPYFKVGIHKKVLLKSKTFISDEVTVKDKFNYVNKELLEVTEEKKLTNENPVDILENNSSLLIKDYGGRGALKTISSRGLSSENTIILFNEAQVNDISTGGFDFSKLSSVSVDKIEYLKSGLDEQTSAGGIIKLFSGNFNNSDSKSIGMKYGSENYQSYFATLNQTWNNFSFQLRGERSYSPNNFEYKFEGNDLNRENADFNKSFISANANYQDKLNVIRFYFHYSYLKNGIPGYVVTNNYNSSSAVNANKTLLPILNYDRQLNQNLFLQTSFHSHYQRLSLSDNQKNIIVGSDKKESDLFDGGASVKLAYNHNSINTSLKYQFDYGELENEYSANGVLSANDFSKRLTNSINGFVDYNFILQTTLIEEIKLGSSISFVNTNETITSIEKNSFINYAFNIDAIPNFINDVSFGLSFSKNNRVPTFNERYYSNLFDNTKLKNEKYTSLDFGVDYQNDVSRIKINLYKIWGTDRIIWVPTRLALQTPKNIGKVETSGVEFSATQRLFNDLINLNAIYTFTDAKNKSGSSSDNSYNKQIVYIPKHKLRTGVGINVGRFSSRTTFSFTSASYFTSDNNPFNRIDSFFLIDQSILYKFDIFDYKSMLSLTVYNLLNEKYLVVQSYPMPLRSFTLSFLLNIN